VQQVEPAPATASAASGSGIRPLYTPEERIRRDNSPWTIVQGVLAPVQFLIFGISLYLVLDYINTGRHYDWAVWSVVVKTFALYTIMITGAIWEKKVFGVYLFHDSFFWEDIFSMLVITLHSLYLFGLVTGITTESQLMATALAAYAAYVVNAAQFVWKLRQARMQSDRMKQSAAPETAQDVPPNAALIGAQAAIMGATAAVIAA
jgi:3-vinyl bacteriochlorophyllide hydratase